MITDLTSEERLRRSKRNWSLAVALVAVTILIGGGLVAVAAHVNPTLSAADLCPANRELETGTTVIVVDATDPWTDVRQAAVAREVEALASDVPRHQRVVLAVVDPDLGELPSDPIALEICNPGSPEQIAIDAAGSGFGGVLAGLVSNPQRARDRYESRFSEVVRASVARAAQAGKRSESPIIETLRTTVIGRRDEAPLDVVLISDLYQNSDLCSMYRVPSCISMGAGLADPTLGGTHDLNGAQVHVALLTPAGGEFIDRESLIQFWYDYFGRQGAIISRITRIEQ